MCVLYLHTVYCIFLFQLYSVFQGLTNLEAFQEQVKNMPIFQQTGSDDDGLQYLNISSFMDGTDGGSVGSKFLER